MNTLQNTPMRAFHNNPAIKTEYLARVEAHRQADDLIRGTFGSAAGVDDIDATSGWRGCAVGCTFHSNEDPHGEAEIQIGVPRILAKLEDRLFENVSEERYKTWPGQFLAAIPVGADLSTVWPQLAVWLLVDTEAGVIRFAKTDGQREAIQRVADLYTKKLSGEEVSRGDWQAARSAAAAAAYADAYAYAADAAYAAAYAADAAADAADAAAAYAGYAYAAYAADAAAYAADAAAAYAGYAYAAYAADAAADAAARRNYYDRMADKLLELLASAPVAEEVVSE